MSQPVTSRKPWWLGIAVMLIGAIWIWGSLKLQISDRLSGLGPGAFVLIIGSGLVLLGALLLWQIARGETFVPEDSEDARGDAPVSYPALALTAVAVFLPALLMPYLGFPVTGAISYALITRALGARNMVRSAAIGFALSSFCWYAFSKLGVQLAGFLPIAGF